MKIEKVSADEAALILPKEDIQYLYNALCITIEELPPSLFKAHTQETSEYAASVRDQLADIVEKIKALEI